MAERNDGHSSHPEEHSADSTNGSSSESVPDSGIEGALSQVDLGELLHRVSLPSLTSLTVPAYVAGSTRSSPDSFRGQAFTSNLGRQGNHSASALSHSSVTDHEREGSTSSGVSRKRKKKLLPSAKQELKDRKKRVSIRRSLPPPRTSSRRRSRFAGFDGLIVGGSNNLDMSVENLYELSAPSPVERRSSRRVSGSLFMPDEERGNVGEVSLPEPVDPDDLHLHQTTSTHSGASGSRQSVVSQVRELAKQQRRSRFSEVDLTSPASHLTSPASHGTRGHFGTPKTYRDDTEDLTLGNDAAPAPSISPGPLSPRRSRLANNGMARSASGLEDASQTSGPRNLALTNALTQLYIYSYLIFFAIFGTLSRIGLKALTFYPGAPVDIPVLWANFSGSLILGFLLEDRNLFTSFSDNDAASSAPTEAKSLEKERDERIQKIKKTIPLYIGLATGFCGSFTSFSSFMLDGFLAMSNNLPSPIDHPYPVGISVPGRSTTVSRSAGYGVMALLGVVLLNVCISLAALMAGAHIAGWLRLPAIPFRFWRRVMDPLFVFLGWGCWLGALLMCIFPPDRPGGPLGHDEDTWADETWRGDALLAIVLAPAGCILRYQLALRLNGVQAFFPLGTFAANVFATAVLAMAVCLQRSSLGQGVSDGVGGGRLGCQVLQGVQDGFCGALSTVSTWAGEIVALEKAVVGWRMGRGYVYGLASVVAGLAVMVLIAGSVLWGVGWEEAVC